MTTFTLQSAALFYGLTCRRLLCLLTLHLWKSLFFFFAKFKTEFNQAGYLLPNSHAIRFLLSCFTIGKIKQKELKQSVFGLLALSEVRLYFYFLR